MKQTIKIILLVGIGLILLIGGFFTGMVYENLYGERYCECNQKDIININDIPPDGNDYAYSQSGIEP